MNKQHSGFHSFRSWFQPMMETLDLQLMEGFEGKARDDLQFLIGFNREPRGGGGGPPSNNDSSAILDHNSGPCDDRASELGTSQCDDDGDDFNDKWSLTMLIKILMDMIS